MPESASHAKLVESMRKWIVDNRFDGDSGHVLVDNAEATAASKPPKAHGFIPDLYAKHRPGVGVIIGEAKTARDLENPHTEAQIRGFLRTCAEETNSLFVLAVPWHMERFARSLVRSIQRRDNTCGVETMVLEKLEG